MRKPVLSLVAVALVAAGCATSGAASQGNAQPPEPPQHHLPTPAPWVDPYVGPTPDPYPVPVDGAPTDRPAVNPYVDPGRDQVSTFGLDIDTASYAIARRAVEAGAPPNPSTVRVEEWVNAFDQGYPAPLEDTFSITADGGPTPFTEPDEVLLRVGLKARDVRDRSRPDAALTFVIDTSGSMAQQDRLEIVKGSLRLLVHGLTQRDTVAIVTFGNDARVVLPPTRASRQDVIVGAIQELSPGGSTNLEAGLRLGYGLARESLTENGIDRVILASDGVANVGLTDPDQILGQIKRDAVAGIELVSVGVGMGDYNDKLLERLADQGDGFYAYVNGPDEAHRLFTEDLTGSLQAVALDARAQVEFDADHVTAYRLVGYEDRAIADQDFRNDHVQAGAIGAGHAVTVLYALRLREGLGGNDRLATVRLRWSDPERGGPSELARDVHAADLARSFRDTGPNVRLDAIVAATAEVLRGSPWMGRLDLREIAATAREDAHGLPPTDEVHDFLILLEELAARGR
jgi:Ca-activated chloride channel family protein